MFGEMLNEMSTSETSDLIEELLEMQEPLKMATRMYRLGEQYYNETHKDIDEASGIKKYVELKSLTEEKLRKRVVDKLSRAKSGDCARARASGSIAVCFQLLSFFFKKKFV